MSSDVDPRTLSYEAEVAPRWAEPFARLLLNVAPIDPKAMVLDVLCGTGSTSLPLLDRLEQRGRVVALDPSSARLAIARRKAGSVVGKRLFFRHEKLERFSFTDDVFDVVVSNAGVLELGDTAVLAECQRVAKPGGTLAMTLALRGTFQELFDFFREVLERREDEEALRRLDAHIHSYPGDDEALSRFESLGLRDVTLSRSTFAVEFPSGRALLRSELAQHLFLERWNAVAGPDATAVLQELAETIDTYLGNDPFELTVQAACLVGHKDVYELVEVAAPLSSVAPAPLPIEAGSPSAGLPANAMAVPSGYDAPDSSDELAADEVTPVRSVAIPFEAAAEASEATSTPILPDLPAITAQPPSAPDGHAPAPAALADAEPAPAATPSPPATPGTVPSVPATAVPSAAPAPDGTPNGAAASAEPQESEIFATREPTGVGPLAGAATSAPTAPLAPAPKPPASAAPPPPPPPAKPPTPPAATAADNPSPATPAGSAPVRRGPPPLPPRVETPEPHAPEGTGVGETTSGSSSAPGPGSGAGAGAGKHRKKRR